MPTTSSAVDELRPIRKGLAMGGCLLAAWLHEQRFRFKELLLSYVILILLKRTRRLKN